MYKYLIIVLVLLLTACDPNGYWTIKYEVEVISMTTGDVIDTYKTLDEVDYEYAHGSHIYHFTDIYQTKTMITLTDSSLINIRYIGDRR